MKKPIKVTVTCHIRGKEVARRVTEIQRRRKPPWYLA